MIKPPPDALSSALNGLNEARSQFANTAERISRGETDVSTLIEAKQEALNVKLQAKNLSIALDQEKEELDILA